MPSLIKSRIGQGDIVSILAFLKPYRRIFLWGEMGSGKSTLAVELLHRFRMRQKTCLLLELDPGTPPFGVPGAISIGEVRKGQLLWESMLPLCTFNSGRFRLPLVLAAQQLMNNVMSSNDRPTILIDPPGVVKGVGGAELLIGFVQTLQVDAILVLCKSFDMPLVEELGALSVPILTVDASSAAVNPTKMEKARWRTRLWDDFLRRASGEECDLRLLNCIGTPPPRNLPEAWRGRQLALLDEAGECVGMGEIRTLENHALITRVVRCSPAVARTVLIRDAGRSDSGYLQTITHKTFVQKKRLVPAEMSSTYAPITRRSPPVSSYIGVAWATLVAGVFGDPILHVRLRNQKRSFFFDLGDPASLSKKIAHQVEAIFLSHAHLDHIGGFIWFLRCRIGPFGACRIFGPKGTIQRIANFLEAIIWDRIEDLGPVFKVAEIEGGRLKRAQLQPGKKVVVHPPKSMQNGIILTDDSFIIRAEICDHNIPSVAYALEFTQEIRIRKDRLNALSLQPGPWLGSLKYSIAKNMPEAVITLPEGGEVSAGELAKQLVIIRPGKKLVYAADMADTEANRRKMINFAQGAHTLFCEAAFSQADSMKAAATQHLTTIAAAHIARSAGVRYLVPFHFSKRYEFTPHVLYDELRAEAGGVQVIGPEV